MANAKPRISPLNLVWALIAVIFIITTVIFLVVLQNRPHDENKSISEDTVIKYKTFGGFVNPDVGTRELVVAKANSTYRIINSNTSAVVSEHSIQTDTQAFASLLSVFRDIRFFDLEGKYAMQNGRIFPDIGISEISLIQDNISKTVAVGRFAGEDLESAPAGFTNITGSLASIIVSINRAYENQLKASAESLIISLPTYKFDGSGLRFAGLTVKSLPPERYVLNYNFTSSHAGYGDRAGQAIAQVITSHYVEVTFSDGQPISAVIDGAWDEILQKPFEQGILPSSIIPLSQSAPYDMTKYGFSTVLSVTNILPGKASVIAIPPYTIEVPAYTFNVPVIFEVLSGNPLDFAEKLHEEEMPLLAFAFHVTDPQTKGLISRFNKTVSLKAANDLIDKHTKYYVAYPNGTLVRDSAGLNVNKGILQRPLDIASVGWLVTYMPAYTMSFFNEMQYQPLQCQETPWNAWYESANSTNKSLETEAAISTAYYNSMFNITVSSFDRIGTNRPACFTCDICSQDYYYTVAVQSTDIPRMGNLGWTRQSAISTAGGQ